MPRKKERLSVRTLLLPMRKKGVMDTISLDLIIIDLTNLIPLRALDLAYLAEGDLR